MKTLNDLKALIDANKTLLGIEINQRELWMENGTIKPGTNKETEQGLHLLDLEYQANLAIDELPGHGDGLLLLLVHQFVSGLDRDELDLPSITIDVNDEHTTDVEVAFTVREPIYVVPVTNSPVMVDGQPMGFGEGALNVAEHVAALNA